MHAHAAEEAHSVFCNAELSACSSALYRLESSSVCLLVLHEKFPTKLYNLLALTSILLHWVSRWIV